MPDVHPPLAAFARRHGLAAPAVDELQALVSRLVAAAAPTRVWSTLHDVLDPVDLEPRTDRTEETEERARPLDRYEDLGLLGVGGMGEVRRVRDRELNRVLAMKVIRAELVGRPAAVARFVEEAQVGAQLQHPGIAPIHELGRLPDGRWYFTMKEIRGRSFTEVIREAHAGPGAVGEVELKRLCDVFATVCDAVGYAHDRGVLHRDLKPDNVMVGAFGEVLVLDWGLAKVLGRAERRADEEEVRSTREGDAGRTRVGQVMGTPAYLAPEQARGEPVTDARADVYALGAVLYEVLTGRPPFDGPDARSVLDRVRLGPPAALPPRLPAALVQLCGQCLAREAADRPPAAETVAREVRAWLEGARARQQALTEVWRAEAEGPRAVALRARATTVRGQGVARLAGVAAWAPEQDKAPGWALLDEAEALDREAALGDERREVRLQRALAHAPDLPEARAALVALELARHAEAEGARDDRRRGRAEALVTEHLGALPDDHPVARRAAAYLTGDGALTLHTEPPGAEVELFRYVPRNRRLVPEPVRRLGSTPLVDVRLPMGSYLCVLRHPERATVRYPVHVGRGERWDGVPPGERDPAAIPLPPRAALADDDVYVPPGWFWSGGDPEAAEGLPRRRLWCDGFVAKRFPVTNHAYLAFLDDLVRSGREEEALAWAPRTRGAAGADGAVLYGRTADGRFELRTDPEGDVWLPDWPVSDVSFACAVAFAAWAARDGVPWRLPAELEREKAARGVDGRYFPWGDAFDASWCCGRDSHPGRPLPARVDAFPVDESVYGVRGVAGNSQDWCADVFVPEGAPVPGARVRSTLLPDGDPTARRANRGGAWSAIARAARCAYRGGREPSVRAGTLGIRLVRSWPA